MDPRPMCLGKHVAGAWRPSSAPLGTLAEATVISGNGNSTGMNYV